MGNVNSLFNWRCKLYTKLCPSSGNIEGRRFFCFLVHDICTEQYLLLFLTDNVLIVQDRTDERSRYLQSQQHTPKKGQEAWWGECTQTTCRFSKLRDYRERKWLLRSPLTFLDWIWETTATSYFMLWAENHFITAALKNLPATTLFTFKLVEHLMSRQEARSMIAVH